MEAATGRKQEESQQFKRAMRRNVKITDVSSLCNEADEPHTTRTDPAVRTHGRSRGRESTAAGHISAVMLTRYASGKFFLPVGCDALGAGHSPGSESGDAVMWPVSHIFPARHRIREAQG